MTDRGYATAPALAGYWLDAHDDDGARWLAGALVPAWRQLAGPDAVHPFVAIDSGSWMALAECDGNEEARKAVEAAAPPPQAGAVGASFRHGKSNLGAAAGRFDDVPYLFVVRVKPPEEWVEPFREWLHDEHFEIQVNTPGLQWVRGYESDDSTDVTFLNMWGVDHPTVPESDAYLEIRDTPWFRRIEPVFAASRMHRAVYRNAGPEEGVA